MRSPDAVPKEERVLIRVEPWQASAVLLVATAAAAVAIYSHVNGGARIFAALLAVAAAVAGVLAARSYLLADGDGIYLRRLRARHMPWDEVESVEVVVRKNQPGLYVFRDGRKTVRVPSYLVLPLQPAGRERTTQRLGGLANRIMAQRPSRRSGGRRAG